MTFVIKKDDLLPIVNACASVARKDATIDVAQLISLSVDDGTITGRSTDLENWIALSAIGDGSLEEISLDAAKLKEVVAGIRGEMLTLAVTDGYLHLSAKGGGKRKVMGRVSVYPMADFPTGDAVTFHIDRLRECLAFCAPTICDDETKMAGALSGIHIHTVNGSYRAVSTTGQSFAAVDISPATSADTACTITRRTISMLDHVPAETSVAVTFADKVGIRWNGGEIVAKKIAMDFVNYATVVTEHEHHLAIRPAEMVAAIRATQATATEEIQAKSKRVRVDLSGDSVQMVSRNQTGDEASEPMDALWSGDAGDVAFVTKRMSDLMSGFGDDELQIGITPFVVGSTEKPKPMLIKSLARPDRFAVLMPLKFL